MNNDDDSEDSKYHPLIVILFGCIERNTVNWKTDGKQELFISEYWKGSDFSNDDNECKGAHFPSE